MLKQYYRLAKPGIVYGNTLTTLAAFFYASRWSAPLPLFLATMAGIALVIASACVFNNFIDRNIDKKMERTKDRALASGLIPAQNALIYGALLALIGFGLLLFGVNTLTFFVALAGFLVYLFLYGFSKRVSHWGTVVGSVSGSAPILVGYTAIVDRLDFVALILFLCLALWQMPHFYAIAIRRSKEYAAAGLPVLPLKKGVDATKLRILAYIFGFLLISCSLALLGYAGLVYFFGMVIVGIIWLWFALQGFKTDDSVKWAKGVFLCSLAVLLAFSILLSVASVLP